MAGDTSLQDSAVLEKRKEDYTWLLIVMIGSYVALGPLTKLLPEESLVPEVFSALTIIPWYFLCFRVTSNFYSNKMFRGLYAGLLIFQLSFNGYVTFQTDATVAQLVLPASIAYVANILGFGVVFYILLKDIFSQKHDLAYGLLGASNIYFLIPILFTYVYCLVALIDPSFIGADPTQIQEVLFNSFNYSWHVIAAIDYPGSVAEAVRLIAVLESISGSLFVVFIIGRLMVK
jgi:hypothetical protein